MGRILSVVKQSDTQTGAASQYSGGMAMAQALQKKCPYPSAFLRIRRMPEQKFVAYREELDGNVYRQSIQTTRPRMWFRVSKDVSAIGGVNEAMTIRMVSRADLLQRFWRHLGAA